MQVNQANQAFTLWVNSAIRPGGLTEAQVSALPNSLVRRLRRSVQWYLPYRVLSLHSLSRRFQRCHLQAPSQCLLYLLYPLR